MFWSVCGADHSNKFYFCYKRNARTYNSDRGTLPIQMVYNAAKMETLYEVGRRNP